MIEELHIRGLGVIEQAALQLAPGLTVVTGETGAGKTMLVTALELLLGARADSSLVRRGSDRAVVEAVIAPPPPGAEEWVGDDEVLIVARELPADGRSRARLAGRLAPVGTLAEVLGSRVEVHAQQEHVRLARPAVQRELLDRYAGDPHARTLTAYRAAYRGWQELVARRDRLRDGARDRARELDRLRVEVAEIDAAAIDPDLDAGLDTEVARLAHADEVRTESALAAAALGGDGAQEPLGTALAALRRLDVDDAELDALRDRLEALVAEAAELAADVRSYGEQVEADPHRLARLQERRALLRGLMRKYGASLVEVLEAGEAARLRTAELEEAEVGADTLSAELEQAATQLDALARDVRRGRELSAARLAEVVDGHLTDLGMPHARMAIAVEPRPEAGPGPDGADRITFLLAPNPGEPPRPIAQAASGGERSRLALAIEVALADVDDAEVLVFDEVDAGVGGATALAVGEKLARLAHGAGGRARQVLCVTHLAQLAAFADVHHVVEKTVVDARTVTTSRQVADEDRVAELARMLGGDAATDAGRAHARELIATARLRRAG